MSGLSELQRALNLRNALADDALEMTDEEIREEMIAEGVDPDELAENMRKLAAWARGNGL